jgi:ribonuclease HIII
MTARTSFTYRLDASQQRRLTRILSTGNYGPLEIPYARIAAEADGCRIALYESGKCLVQGKGAADWIRFTLEPLVLEAAQLGYETVLDPSLHRPHMGIDESGKGDYFGPLVVAAAYVDEELAETFRSLDVRDSKRLSSDRRALEMARAIREALGNRFALVTIGPRAYNRLYAKIGNVNRLLAWGHARVMENLLRVVPECPRAVADQFGPERQIRQALLKRGRRIELEQRPRAETDPAVAAASVLARAAFVHALGQMGKARELDLPKGASARVVEAAGELVDRAGAPALLDAAKCHFRTTDKVLAARGLSREDLGPEGRATSRARVGRGVPGR